MFKVIQGVCEGVVSVTKRGGRFGKGGREEELEDREF